MPPVGHVIAEIRHTDCHLNLFSFLFLFHLCCWVFPSVNGNEISCMNVTEIDILSWSIINHLGVPDLGSRNKSMLSDVICVRNRHARKMVSLNDGICLAFVYMEYGVF